MDESLRRHARTARAQIAAGTLRGAALLAQLRAVPVRERDAWIDEALGIELPPPDVALPRGSVPYLPCGVDEIIAMVVEVPLGPDDLLVDLGSGLGRVVILGHLLSGARACGIELQEHLVARSRARCAELALSSVSFVCANAAEYELDGDVFFLYAPFNGEMLARALRRLEYVARRKPTVVVSTIELELDVPWLRARTAASSAALTIYDSVPGGVAASG